MMYKKIILISLLVLPIFMWLSIPNRAMAVDVISGACDNPNIPAGERPTVCKDNQANSPSTGNPLLGKDGVVTKGVQLFVVIVGVVSVFVLLVNATRLITGGAEPASVNSAKNGILYAVIGLAIVASAQAIVAFVIKKL